MASILSGQWQAIAWSQSVGLDGGSSTFAVWNTNPTFRYLTQTLRIHSPSGVGWGRLAWERRLWAHLGRCRSWSRRELRVGWWGCILGSDGCWSPTPVISRVYRLRNGKSSQEGENGFSKESGGLALDFTRHILVTLHWSDFREECRGSAPILYSVWGMSLYIVTSLGNELLVLILWASTLPT